MTHRRAPLVALLGAVLLTGCSGQQDTASVPSTAASQQTPTVATPSSPRPGATNPTDEGNATLPATAAPPMDDHGDELPTTTETVAPDAASEAEDRATAFLRAFARTDLAQDAWWTGIEGYFTPQARAIYEATDVANVPVSSVVEDSARFLEDTSTPYRTEVAVDTDAGTYTVVLVRADGAWLVERATPPS